MSAKALREDAPQRYGSAMTTPEFQRLLEVAYDHHGYVTTAQITRAGVDPAGLRQLAASGQVERITVGLYRLPIVPRTVLTEFAEATLWANGRGVISHSSALALHDLAPVNPARIHLTVRTGYRPSRAGGDLYRVWTRNLPRSDCTTVEGIAVVTPRRAIEDARKLGEDPTMVALAIRNAADRGFLTASEEARLLD